MLPVAPGGGGGSQINEREKKACRQPLTYIESDTNAPDWMSAASAINFFSCRCLAFNNQTS